MSQEVATTNKSQVTLSGILEQYKGEVARALPRHVTPERMLRIAMTSARKNPELLTCSPESFLGAVIQSAQVGLEPDTPLGHAALVPFNNRATGKKEVNFMPMYRGYMDLVYRCADHPILDPVAVYEGDHFKWRKGTNPGIEHEPMPRKDGAKLTHAYVVSTFADGRKVFTVMTRAEIEACRARSKAQKFTPWQTDYEAMSLKTVIRRHCKYLPMSAEMQRAIGLDEAMEAGISQQNDVLLKEGQPIHTKAERIDAKMAQPADDPTSFENFDK